MVDLFDTARGLQLALIQAVSAVARGSADNQNDLVSAGATQHIVNAVLAQSHHNKEIQESAVEVIHRLSENSAFVQHDMLECGVDCLLLQLLKKPRNAESLLEKTALALWSLAGSDVNERRDMAAGIGLQTVVEFVNSSSDNLQLIGSEALGVLAQGPALNQIVAANGIHPLVRLLGSSQEAIVLSVIRSL